MHSTNQALVHAVTKGITSNGQVAVHNLDNKRCIQIDDCSMPITAGKQACRQAGKLSVVFRDTLMCNDLEVWYLSVPIIIKEVRGLLASVEVRPNGTLAIPH